jgi:hypothetical protein
MTFISLASGNLMHFIFSSHELIVALANYLPQDPTYIEGTESIQNMMVQAYLKLIETVAVYG